VDQFHSGAVDHFQSGGTRNGVRETGERRSRDEDRRALESGQESREQLRQENGLFSGMKVRVEFDKAKALS
jgi:hypothetical protein